MLNPTVPQAYTRLGVKREVVATHPRVTPQIRKLGKMLENLNLNLPRDPYYYLAASEDPDAREIIRVRASIPRTFANLLPIEAFCVAAAVPTTRVLEMMTIVAMRLGAQSSTILAALSHPEVVKKTVERALTDEGIEDRTTLHKATGFLPQPKGAHTQINVHANANSTAASNAQAASVGAPAPENSIRRLSERLNLRRAQSQPALPESTATVLEVPPESDLVEVEREEADDSLI